MLQSDSIAKYRVRALADYNVHQLSSHASENWNWRSTSAVAAHLSTKVGFNPIPIVTEISSNVASSCSTSIENIAVLDRADKNVSNLVHQTLVENNTTPLLQINSAALSDESMIIHSSQAVIELATSTLDLHAIDVVQGLVQSFHTPLASSVNDILPSLDLQPTDLDSSVQIISSPCVSSSVLSAIYVSPIKTSTTPRYEIVTNMSYLPQSDLDSPLQLISNHCASSPVLFATNKSSMVKSSMVKPSTATCITSPCTPVVCVAVAKDEEVFDNVIDLKPDIEYTLEEHQNQTSLIHTGDELNVSDIMICEYNIENASLSVGNIEGTEFVSIVGGDIEDDYPEPTEPPLKVHRGGRGHKIRISEPDGK